MGLGRYGLPRPNGSDGGHCVGKGLGIGPIQFINDLLWWMGISSSSCLMYLNDKIITL